MADAINHDPIHKRMGPIIHFMKFQAVWHLALLQPLPIDMLFISYFQATLHVKQSHQANREGPSRNTFVEAKPKVSNSEKTMKSYAAMYRKERTAGLTKLQNTPDSGGNCICQTQNTNLQTALKSSNRIRRATAIMSGQALLQVFVQLQLRRFLGLLLQKPNKKWKNIDPFDVRSPF